MAKPKVLAQRGQATLEYVAIIAAAAVLVVAVAIALTSHGSTIAGMGGSAVCKVKSMGHGKCPESTGGSTNGGGNGGGSSGGGGSKPKKVDLPKGLSPNDPIVKTMETTQRGRNTLQWLADNHIPIVMDPSERGAYWDGTEIVLGGGEQSAPALVHETNHAKYAKEGRHANVKTESRSQYIHDAIAEEVDGTVQQIQAAKEFRAKGQKIPQQPGEDAYTAAYNNAIKNGESKAAAESPERTR